MKLTHSSGGWKPLKHDEKTQAHVQKGGSKSAKEKFALFAVISGAIAAGGAIYSHFMGSHK